MGYFIWVIWVRQSIISFAFALHECTPEFFPFWLQVGEEKHIIWAYGDGDIRGASDFDRHAQSGVGINKLVIVDKQPVPTQAAVSLLHSRINAILVAVAIVFLNVLVI